MQWAGDQLALSSMAAPVLASNFIVPSNPQGTVQLWEPGTSMIQAGETWCYGGNHSVLATA